MHPIRLTQKLLQVMALKFVYVMAELMCILIMPAARGLTLA